METHNDRYDRAGRIWLPIPGVLIIGTIASLLLNQQHLFDNWNWLMIPVLGFFGAIAVVAVHVWIEDLVAPLRKEND
jgi:hypothetical protein